jgi:hypothetical protein
MSRRARFRAASYPGAGVRKLNRLRGRASRPTDAARSDGAEESKPAEEQMQSAPMASWLPPEAADEDRARKSARSERGGSRRTRGELGSGTADPPAAPATVVAGCRHVSSSSRRKIRRCEAGGRRSSPHPANRRCGPEPKPGPERSPIASEAHSPPPEPVAPDEPAVRVADSATDAGRRGVLRRAPAVGEREQLRS